MAVKRSVLGMYRLDPEIGGGKVPVPVDDDDPLTWGRWMEGASRQVARDHVGTLLVSTVFLGLDHAFGGGPPMLFETMVFDESDRRTFTMPFFEGRTYTPSLDEFTERHSTWEIAEERHRAIVEELRQRMEVEGVVPR